jgi:hypothetical protein
VEHRPPPFLTIPTRSIPVFKLDQSNTYWYPVTVEMTDQDGRRQKMKFDAQFERVSQDEINELFRKRDDDEAPIKDSDVLDRVFRGWRGVQDADGTELAVNDENREKLLNVFPVPTSIVRAFLKSIGIEGKAKN